MSKPSDRPRIVLPSRARDAAIIAAAESDPDALPLTDAQLAAMVPLRSLRGRPPTESRKLLVSIRYSPEVLAYFRGMGKGWQTRMDDVLRSYVAQQGGKE